MLYIHHHLGLGDHIICNGLVRYVKKNTSFNLISLVVKKKYLTNIQRMYKDCEWIRFTEVNYDHEFNQNLLKSPDMFMKIGFENCIASQFDRSFYDDAGVPFKERWDSFYVERDLNDENELIDELKLPDKFVLVHDQSSIGKYDLNIKTNLPIVKIKKTESEKSIFDWIGVIHRATEIHCIDSSFIHLVDSLNNITTNLYYHNTKNNNIGFSQKHLWKMVNYVQ